MDATRKQEIVEICGHTGELAQALSERPKAVQQVAYPPSISKALLRASSFLMSSSAALSRGSTAAAVAYAENAQLELTRITGKKAA